MHSINDPELSNDSARQRTTQLKAAKKRAYDKDQHLVSFLTNAYSVMSQLYVTSLDKISGAISMCPVMFDS